MYQKCNARAELLFEVFVVVAKSPCYVYWCYEFNVRVTSFPKNVNGKKQFKQMNQ